MRYTYRCDTDFDSVELVEVLQSFYNLPVQFYVWLNTVAEMQQDSEGKHTLHHTAAPSLSLSSFTASRCLKCESWCEWCLPILFIHSKEMQVTDVVIVYTYLEMQMISTFFWCNVICKSRIFIS